MAYTADDYELRCNWVNPTSGAIAQVNFAIQSSEGPDTIAASLDAALTGGGGGAPTIWMNDHAALATIDVFSLFLHGVVFTRATCTAQGLQGAGLTPVNSCVVLTLLTGSPGRSNRGRQYWPFIDSGLGADDGARWNPAFYSGGSTAGDNLLSTLAASNATWCVNSRKNATLEALTNTRINTYIGTQRRRAERFE